MTSAVDFRRQSRSVFAALLPVLFMACYYYGIRALLLGAAAAAPAFAAALLGRRFQRPAWREPWDLSGVNTGLMVALLLPASAPYWLVVVGAIFAMLVIRHPFGGYSATLFHPANTAFAFLIICWPSLVTGYPQPMQQLPLGKVDVPLYASPAARLMVGGAERLDWMEILMGSFVGPMGATCVLVLLLCGCFLAFRRAILWQVPLAVFGVVALFAWLMPRTGASTFLSVSLELVSGTLIFSTIFVAALDSGEIHTGLGRWLYGILLGLAIVLFRTMSQIELVTPFAIIIMGTLDHRCDAMGAAIRRVLIRLTGRTGQLTLQLLRQAGGKLAAAGRFCWGKLAQLLQMLVDGKEKP